MDVRGSIYKDWYCSDANDDQKLLCETYNNPEIMGNLYLYDGAIEFLKFYEQFYNIIILTSASQSIRNVTESLVNNNVLNQINGKLFFAQYKGNFIDKLMLTHNIKPSNIVCIDDSPFNVHEFLRLRIRTIMISNSTTVYNHYCRGIKDMLFSHKKSLKHVKI